MIEGRLRGAQAVIFDCDGVLVDSEGIAIRVLRDRLQQLVPNRDISPLLADAAGRQTSDIIADVAREVGRNFPSNIVRSVDQLTHEALDRELEPIPGVKAVLAGIQPPIAVASNSIRSRVLKSLQVTGLDGFRWKAIFSAEQVPQPKPAPDLYLFAASELGLDPSACLVIEDSDAGVRAATAAGTTVIGFVGASHIGVDHAVRLRAAGATFIAERMETLGEMLESAGIASFPYR